MNLALIDYGCDRLLVRKSHMNSQCLRELLRQRNLYFSLTVPWEGSRGAICQEAGVRVEIHIDHLIVMLWILSGYQRLLQKI